MNEPAILGIWLIGLFGLIGAVLAAVAQLVEKDTMNYDSKFTWKSRRTWDPEKDFDHKT